ncbi:MAG: DUF1501 domain-containing protein, partial [Gemmataceae bacterium]
MTHSHRLSRRDWLSRSAQGFGALAFNALLAQEKSHAAGPLSPRAPHHPAKAKSVIFLYMDGGVGQMDSFDPKPRLTAENGQPFKMKKEPTQFNNNGNTLASPWKFAPRGKSGLPVSDLFPQIATQADKLCVLRSMVSNFSEHTNANYFFHSGHGQQGRPSFGAWTTYGLGAINQELPGFVILNAGLIPPGGVDCFSSGFLPATFQGSVFKSGHLPLPDLTPAPSQSRTLKLIQQLDAGVKDRLGPNAALDTAIQNHELAARMQTAIPQLYDLSSETTATKTAYGLDQEHTRIYGTQCLLARRLVERGVRFIELTCPKLPGLDRWDQHSNLKQGHAENARAVDQPIA